MFRFCVIEDGNWVQEIDSLISVNLEGDICVVAETLELYISSCWMQRCLISLFALVLSIG